MRVDAKEQGLGRGEGGGEGEITYSGLGESRSHGIYVYVAEHSKHPPIGVFGSFFQPNSVDEAEGEATRERCGNSVPGG